MMCMNLLEKSIGKKIEFNKNLGFTILERSGVF